MIKMLSLCLFIAAASLIISPAQALPASNDLCGKRLDIIDTLKTRYSEEPVSMGLSRNGGVLEVFASEGGTWTIVVTRPTGVACVVSAGEAWESLKGPGTAEPGV